MAHDWKLKRSINEEKNIFSKNYEKHFFLSTCVKIFFFLYLHAKHKSYLQNFSEILLSKS